MLLVGGGVNLSCIREAMVWCSALSIVVVNLSENPTQGINSSPAYTTNCIKRRKLGNNTNDHALSSTARIVRIQRRKKSDGLVGNYPIGFSVLRLRLFITFYLSIPVLLPYNQPSTFYSLPRTILEGGKRGIHHVFHAQCRPAAQPPRAWSARRS